jgi:hypothetical protein
MLSSLFPFWVFGTSTDVEFVWGVFIILCCGLAFTAYCVAYILIMASKEMQEDGQVREQGQKGSEQTESGQRDSEEGQERG